MFESHLFPELYIELSQFVKLRGWIEFSQKNVEVSKILEEFLQEISIE